MRRSVRRSAGDRVEVPPRGSMRGRARAGFTLMEVLVVLFLIALLAGAIVPAVLTQVDRGEINRLMEDLESVRSATKMFRTDVLRWPRRLAQLSDAPSAWTADSLDDAFDAAIPERLRDRWAGPYLELGAIKGDSLVTALGGVIISPLTTLEWSGTPFVLVKVKHISEQNAKKLSQLVDGDEVVDETGISGGRVRWKAGSPDTLLYLAAPAN